MSGIYDSAWLQPIAKIKENLTIYTGGGWNHYRIEFSEPMPPGPASIVDMLAIAPAVANLAANGTKAAAIVNVIQLDEGEFLHLRWAPVDDVEGRLWELAGQGRYRTARLHCRTSLLTARYDPQYASTTFWVLGIQRDAQIETLNPNGYVIPIARFMFWGHRYLIHAHDFKSLTAADRAALRDGDLEAVRRFVGATTWVPAQGYGRSV